MSTPIPSPSMYGITGSLGTTTPSSDGYLIPDDFTQENKDKVGKLIAVLKGNNVFD